MKQNSNKNKKRNNKKQQTPRVSRIRSIEFGADTLVRRFTIGSQVVSTNGFGIVPVTTNFQSDQCSQFPSSEWASYAARFGQYRVLKFSMHLRPTMPVNSGVIATNLLSSMYFSDFMSTTIPTTAVGIVSDRSFREFSTGRAIVYQTTWARNPNAKLWTPTSTAIPATSRYGIAYCSHPNVNLLPVNQILFTLYLEFEVELGQVG
jgi:hypothetical protein